MFTRPAWSLRLAFVTLTLTLAMLRPAGAADEPRIDQVQVIGSHNSYHLAPPANALELLGARSNGLDYTHKPLAEQFSRLGLRSIELDVFADPVGGRYAEPWARKLLKRIGKDPGPDPDADGHLRKPGMKVFHVQDIDYLTTVPTLVDGLRQVRDWSRAHPSHVPILIQLELKDDAVAALPTRPMAFGKAELDAVDAEIRSVFQPGEFLAPDDVRGDSETLREAIQSRGWPTLGASRGKVLFALDNEGAVSDLYLADHPALRGRAMFVSVAPDHPAAAWMKRNDPVREFDEIQSLVKAGFLVRTRADADTAEARKGDGSRLEKALASGAQVISTDDPEPRPEWSPYQAKLPGGVVARSNPVSGDKSLAGIDLDAPPHQP
jgi:hypothetical protein